MVMTSVAGNWQPRALCRGNHSHLFFPPSTFERKEERETARDSSQGYLQGMSGEGRLSGVGRRHPRAVRHLGWPHRGRASGILGPDGLRPARQSA